MNITILLVGHWRDALTTDLLKNAIKKFKKAFEICDIYVHTWDRLEASKSYRQLSSNSQKSKITEKMIRKYIDVDIENIKIEKQTDNLIHGKTTIDSFQGTKKFGASCRGNKFVYYALKEAYMMAKLRQKEKNIIYDYVIRIRPDLYNLTYVTDHNIEKLIKDIKLRKQLNNKRIMVGMTFYPGKPLGDNFYYMAFQDFAVFVNYMIDNFDDINEHCQKICSEAYINEFIKANEFKSESVSPANNTKYYLQFFLEKIIANKNK